MPLETLFSSPNPTVTRARSMLSRFTNPIAKHARNLTDFEIELADPWKRYSPGEIVKGNVVLTVAKGFEITHLVIALHGYAKVFKNLVTPGEGNPETELLVNGKGTSGFEYHGRGLASLFQDEQVLCGIGFLERQIYKFGFELEFPSTRLPSSIKFERGTVSYIISATLTRPVAIAPTSTCYETVRFQDDIDIAYLSSPKSRVISLEPLTRRGKVKRLRQSPSIRTQDTDPSKSLVRRNTDTDTTCNGRAIGLEPPLSPAPSEDTVATNTSASSLSLRIVTHPTNNTRPAVRSSDTRSTNTSSSSHTITATTEIMKQGALPDDIVPIRILVQHTKPIRGIVIVTLYRQARVDMNPAIPIGRKGKGKEQEYEDIYTKSRTGLGGLYFANGSPSSLFRKDLAQSSTMMVVDPQTLVADVKTSIRVPKEAIPTIENVPGDMISFKYYVEVVLDLCGKLGETRFLPSLTSNGPSFTYASEANNQLSSEWANNILDTAEIRRTKSVVSLRFSLTIGTRDSGRDSGRRQNGTDSGYFDENGYHYTEEDQHDYEYYDENGYNHWSQDESEYPPYDSFEGDDYIYQSPPTQLIPPPEPEEEVDEKTRLRRQEELLLPSRPPQEAEGSTSTQEFAPSAPFMPDAHAPGGEATGPSASNHVVRPSGVSTRSVDTIRPSAVEGDDVPDFEQVDGPRPTEDKQELERRRLMAQASAPPTDDVDGDVAEGSSAPPFAATAPVLNEDGEYNAQTLNNVHTSGEHLPQYKR